MDDLFAEILERKIAYKNPSAVAFFIRQIQNRTNLMFALVTTWLYSNTKNGMADMITGELERLTSHQPILMRQYIRDYKNGWTR